MNVVVIGHICIDRNISENSMYMSSGGPAVFIHKVYNQLPNVFFTAISSYGKDLSQYIKNMPIYPAFANINKSLIYENKSKKGIRTQKAFNRTSSLPPKIDGKMIKILKKADIIYIAPLLPNFSYSYLKKINKHLKKSALRIILPQGYFRDFDKKNNVIPRGFNEENEILSLVDIVIISEEDEKDMKNKAKKWIDVNNGLICIITLGEKGAMIMDKKQNIIIPTKPVLKENIIDSVGSGDIFSAAFGYKYVKTNNVRKSCRYANNIAYKCLFFASNDIRF